MIGPDVGGISTSVACMRTPDEYVLAPLQRDLVGMGQELWDHTRRINEEIVANFLLPKDALYATMGSGLSGLDRFLSKDFLAKSLGLDKLAEAEDMVIKSVTLDHDLTRMENILRIKMNVTRYAENVQPRYGGLFSSISKLDLLDLW